MGLIYSYSGIYEIDPNKKSSIFIFKNSFVTVTYSDFCRKMLEIFGFLFYIFLIISFRNYKAISIELMKKKNQQILKQIQRDTHIVMRWHGERRKL